MRKPSVYRDRFHRHALHDRPGTHPIGNHHAVSVPDLIPERLVVGVVPRETALHGLPVIGVGMPYSNGSAIILSAKLLHPVAVLYWLTDADGTYIKAVTSVNAFTFDNVGGVVGSMRM